ncbi:class I SAM-dependent methyltransferase [Haloarchaeobius iranensis]|uniref:Methyltransferase domain-containing protein n=1 Tax=Haloarchaeobius iranensis TaxID=996166 RepID=A0A1G9VN37_9EURY|nr:methyltransferase domain-containing protein [Haloarchaeobius iranensis]SDM73516.1 Methyltransferase domain-containing protein [Haloarchaeobius iranensis]
MTDDPVLSDTDRAKLDSRSDDAFYDQPRFVHHVDEGFRERLTDLYREHLTDGDRVLDAMSSWVSHLPDDREFGRVVGHGLNEAELAENPRLDEYVVQNLNADQRLPAADGGFDAVLCAVSVQYLQYPTAVFREFYRVLAPGGVLVVSFSNRTFRTKAIRAWRERSMDERAALVRSYCESAGFDRVETVSDERRSVLPGVGGDPFYAVVAGRG